METKNLFLTDLRTGFSYPNGGWLQASWEETALRGDPGKSRRENCE
jgi:hypothetical protein